MILIYMIYEVLCDLWDFMWFMRYYVIYEILRYSHNLCDPWNMKRFDETVSIINILWDIYSIYDDDD